MINEFYKIKVTSKKTAIKFLNLLNDSNMMYNVDDVAIDCISSDDVELINRIQKLVNDSFKFFEEDNEDMSSFCYDLDHKQFE